MGIRFLSKFLHTQVKIEGIWTSMWNSARGHLKVTVSDGPDGRACATEMSYGPIPSCNSPSIRNARAGKCQETRNTSISNVLQRILSLFKEPLGFA